MILRKEWRFNRCKNNINRNCINWRVKTHFCNRKSNNLNLNLKQLKIILKKRHIFNRLECCRNFYLNGRISIWLKSYITVEQQKFLNQPKNSYLIVFRRIRNNFKSNWKIFTNQMAKSKKMLLTNQRLFWMDLLNLMKTLERSKFPKCLTYKNQRRCVKKVLIQKLYG